MKRLKILRTQIIAISLAALLSAVMLVQHAQASGIKGTVEGLTGTTLRVNGQTVTINGGTEIGGTLAMGAPVALQVLVRPDGSLLALEIEVTAFEASEDDDDDDDDDGDDDDGDDDDGDDDDGDDDDSDDDDGDDDDGDDDDADDDDGDDDDADDGGAGGTTPPVVTPPAGDITPPVVTPPADITVQATGPLTPVAIGTATATDAVGVVSISSDAPASFPLGTFVVTWTATDAAGNTGTATQNITIGDTTPPPGDITPPVVTPPADISVPATGPLTPVAIGTATATDAVGVVSISSDAPASFPVGTFVVTWTATDAAGNAGTATQSISVEDATPPVVTAPADITVPATGPLTPVAIGTATATDAVGVVSIFSDAPASFPVGTTVVTWTATDAAGNAGTATQSITIGDATPAPTIDAAQIYASNCAVCHGATRQGGFYGGLKPKDMAGKSDAKLTDVIANGKDSMPAYSGTLTPEEIAALVQWLRTP